MAALHHAKRRVGQWFAEAVATFGLLLAIFGCAPVAPAATAYAVGLYITAAYWDASQLNPEVSIEAMRALFSTDPGVTTASLRRCAVESKPPNRLGALVRSDRRRYDEDRW